MKMTKTQIARSLRQEQTPAEEKLWSVLRNRKFKNLKFRRQHPVKDYIVDFFCQELKLVLELDGEYHYNPEQKEKDELRDLHFKMLGYYVLRFENKVVFENRKLIFDEITMVKNERQASSKENKIKSKQGSSPLSSLHPTSEAQARGMQKGVGGEGLEGISILSTKTLTLSQRNLLLAAGKLSLVEYNAIKIRFIDFEMPKNIKNAIFTSQNTVRAIQNSEFKIQNCYCVGKKTAALLQKSGFNVVKTVEYGSKSASYIAENHNGEKFHFFCGNKRREEIPAILTKAGIDFEEIVVYKNAPNSKKFDQKFDAVLFYSPSGVKSFAEKNVFGESLAVCIGKTTATEAKKHTKNVEIANTTSVESVIVKAVKVLREG